MIKAFIVGMPRSGSTWLMHQINNTNNIVSFGETAFWGKLDMSRQDLYDVEKIDLLLAKLKEQDLDQIDICSNEGGQLKVISNVLENVRKKYERISRKDLFNQITCAILKAENKKYAIEKTPHHINYVDLISRNYPNCLFIVMKRAPWEFMLSYKSQGLRKGNKDQADFKNYYHPIGCSLVYKKYQKAIDRTIKEYESRALLIRTEDIASNSKKVIDSMSRFLDSNIKLMKTQKINSSYEGIENKPKLDPIDYFWMSKINNLHPPKGSSVSLVEILKSIFVIPIWGVNVIRIMKKHSGKGVISYLIKWVT